MANLESVQPFADEVSALLTAMATPAGRTAAVVDRYYTHCIPFYREFLGRHWHTGCYEASGAIGPADQLRMERLIAASAAIDGASTVLDVGCGIGGTACHLAQATGARFHGLTPNTTQLELARQHAQALGLQRQVSFQLGMADALPFADAQFDAVLFFESACHFSDRARFFAEACRVLKPGGRLAGEDWLAVAAADPVAQALHAERIGQAWAIPALGTLASYRRDMVQAGLAVQAAVDMRSEMALARGFIVGAAQRAEVVREAQACADPIRRQIMGALVILGDAVAAGAFTIGRFLAIRPA